MEVGAKKVQQTPLIFFSNFFACILKNNFSWIPFSSLIYLVSVCLHDKYVLLNAYVWEIIGINICINIQSNWFSVKFYFLFIIFYYLIWYISCYKQIISMQKKNPVYPSCH